MPDRELHRRRNAMVGDLTRTLEQHKRDWEDLAELDHFWSVLAHPDKKHKRWPPEEFFATGKEVIEQALGILEDFGITVQRTSALDFGCGLGRLTVPLAQSFKRCIGVDISVKMVALAQEYHLGKTGVSFETIDRQDLSLFSDQSFDLVISFLVLQHQPCVEAVELWLREMVRVLRPEGILMFQLPCRLGFRSRLQLRRRAYRLLRGLGGSRELLYRIGLHPMRMLALRERRVEQILEGFGCTVRKVLRDHSAGRNQSRLYIASR